MVLALGAFTACEAPAVLRVGFVEADDAMQRRAERGVRDRDLDVVGVVRGGEVVGGAPQLALGLLVAAELGEDRRELAAVAGGVGVGWAAGLCAAPGRGASRARR